MKNLKKGFTLAEVLITLGIIGVISALTLPMFTVNAKYQALASKISSTLSSVENGFAAMMSADSADDMTETNYWRNNKSTGELAEFLKVEEVSAPYASCETLSGTTINLSPNKTYLMKNGAVIMIQYKEASLTEAQRLAKGASVAQFLAQVDIDVNGSEKPNKYGRDVFRFGLGSNGHLYPCGSLNYSLLTNGDKSLYWKTTTENDAKCNDTNKSVACTARLIEENFKINF